MKVLQLFKSNNPSNKRMRETENPGDFTFLGEIPDNGDGPFDCTVTPELAEVFGKTNGKFNNRAEFNKACKEKSVKVKQGEK